MWGPKNTELRPASWEARPIGGRESGHERHIMCWHHVCLFSEAYRRRSELSTTLTRLWWHRFPYIKYKCLKMAHRWSVLLELLDLQELTAKIPQQAMYQPTDQIQNFENRKSVWLALVLQELTGKCTLCRISLITTLSRNNIIILNHFKCSFFITRIMRFFHALNTAAAIWAYLSLNNLEISSCWHASR